jgi:glycerol kinase
MTYRKRISCQRNVGEKQTGGKMTPTHLTVTNTIWTVLYALVVIATATEALATGSSSYVGALDQGTSSTRFVIFNQNGDVVSSSQMEHKQIYPKPGWVEHDAEEIWLNCVDVITASMAKANLNSKDVASIGITNQRETTVVWDKSTGKPLHNAVVWNCGRTSEIVSEFQSRLGGVDALREITG